MRCWVGASGCHAAWAACQGLALKTRAGCWVGHGQKLVPAPADMDKVAKQEDLSKVIDRQHRVCKHDQHKPYTRAQCDAEGASLSRTPHEPPAMGHAAYTGTHLLLMLLVSPLACRR